MIGKIVSNWLTSTDERGYQQVYAQLLALRGHRVLHVSSHGPMEAGKDIVSVDSQGLAHGFQLKIGDLDLGRWRREVRPEIEELLDLPLEHPSLPGGSASRHESVLVTTGRLKDTVKQQIEAMNRGRHRRRQRQLKVVVGGEIEQEILALHGDLPAWTPSDFGKLLHFHLHDGTENLDASKFDELLAGMFARTHDGASGRRDAALVAKALVLTAYALEPFRRAGNHLAVAQGWTLLACRAVAYAEEINLVRARWVTSVRLCIGAAQASLHELEREALESEDFIEPGLSDPVVRRFRLVELLRWISSYRLSRLLDGDPEWRETRVMELVKRILPEALLWGEAAVPAWLLSGLLAGAHAEGSLQIACIGGVLSAVVDSHGHEKHGLPSPYYNAEQVARFLYGRMLGPGYGPIVCREPIEEEFNRHSFMLWPLVLLSTRMGLRQLLKHSWPGIADVLREEFVPSRSWDRLLWKGSGRLCASFAQQPQSWSALKREAEEASAGATLPRRLREVPALLPLFLAAMPHRVCAQLTLHLDRVVGDAL